MSLKAYRNSNHYYSRYPIKPVAVNMLSTVHLDLFVSLPIPPLIFNYYIDLRLLFFCYRKTFSKILKETVRRNDGNAVQGKTEVIAALRTIYNKDDTFAALTRNLAKLNKKGIKVFAQNGQIQFNGVAIDMTEFCAIKGTEVNSFLNNLPLNNDVKDVQVLHLQKLFNLNGINMPNINEIVTFSAKLINCYNNNVKGMIISTVAKVLVHITEPLRNILKEMLPNSSRWYLLVLEGVLKFFAEIAKIFEEKYQNWEKTKSKDEYLPLFDTVDLEKVKRCIKFMEMAISTCCEFTTNTQKFFERIIRYCYVFICDTWNEFEQKKERKSERECHSAKMRFTPYKVTCNVCGGHYFTNAN